MPAVNRAISSVDEYIAAQPPGAQAALKKLRAAVRKGAPLAEELISYKMPTYKMGARLVLHFAAWKHHVSLYPASDTILSKFKAELEAYEIDNRTIRFPIDKPVPDELIERIARLRAEEMK